MYVWIAIGFVAVAAVVGFLLSRRQSVPKRSAAVLSVVTCDEKLDALNFAGSTEKFLDQVVKELRASFPDTEIAEVTYDIEDNLMRIALDFECCINYPELVGMRELIEKLFSSKGLSYPA